MTYQEILKRKLEIEAESKIISIRITQMDKAIDLMAECMIYLKNNPEDKTISDIIDWADQYCKDLWK